MLPDTVLDVAATVAENYIPLWPIFLAGLVGGAGFVTWMWGRAERRRMLRWRDVPLAKVTDTEGRTWNRREP